jgi:hypothetical protein
MAKKHIDPNDPSTSQEESSLLPMLLIGTIVLVVILLALKALGVF